MKDPWIQAFQDRMGDFELDVPVPPIARKRKVWPLFVAAGAAAAAAALLLLLPGHRTSLSPQPLGLPGERQTALMAEALPEARPLKALYRRKSPEAAFVNPTVAFQETILNEQEAVESTVNDEAGDRHESINDHPVIVAEDLTPEQEWWQTEEPTPHRTAGGFSTKVHVGNTFFPQASKQTVDPTGIAYFHEQTAKASQDIYEATLNGNLSSNYSAGSVFEPQWNCRLPIKAGLSIRYQITPVFGVESGLEYSYHYAETTDQTARFHFIGIPVNVSARLVQWGRRLQVYTTLGEETEWLVAGRYESHDAGSYNTTDIQQHPFQFSLMGAAGLDFTLTPGFSLYVEPGVAWHAKMKVDLPSYYSQHPLSFDLRAGLRFTL